MDNFEANPNFRAKLKRFRSGEKLRVLDLFAGCGGISLGFHKAGFSIDAAVEVDKTAAATHSLNFHCGDHNHSRARDITAIEPEELTEDLSLGAHDTAFDVVVGGPPCQAYARVGRAKLREVADHPEAFRVDPRGNLYLRYLHYVRKTKPLAVLVENVPDVLNYGGHNVMAEMAEVLSDLGYVAKYTLVSTAFHGVPQLRDRVFLMAIHRSLGASVCFPGASNHLVLSSGYEGTRAVAMKHIDMFSSNAFEEADHGTRELPGPVSASEAIADLPKITLHLEGKLKRGARRFDTPIPYPRSAKLSSYAELMRNWSGFEAPEEGLADHVIRYLPRDTDIFREMPNGAEYPKAHETATKLWERKVAELECERGKELTRDEREVLHRSMVPPYPVHTFPNRWWKLRADAPVRTLMAHIGKDTYSHIHYDSEQARVISVREAARLQSFPDGFRFCGTMNPAYRQIGNAVPPLMAYRLASQMLSLMKSDAGSQTDLVAAE